jgi:hypothetical protein
MDIVVIKRDQILLSPNEQYSVPDGIGQQLVDRGTAEDISKVVAEMKVKGKKVFL